MNEENQINIKVTLLGNSGVGKTSIITRYTEEKFTQDNNSTSGANYSRKSLIINDKKIELDLWDTAGQEKYRSLGRHFYKDSSIVCLIYDITKIESFHDLKIWYDDLKTYGEKYNLTAVVGNKMDCYEIEQVSEDEGRKYAEEINSQFFLVSAKTGDNVENLFNSLIKIYLGPEFSEKKSDLLNEQEKSKTIKVSKSIHNKSKKIKFC